MSLRATTRPMSVRRGSLGRFPRGLLAVVAIADMVGLHLPREMQPFFVPIALVAVGVYMLVER